MSSPHDPYRLGYTRVTRMVHKKKRSRKSERISKSHLISDCPLQLEGMKLESLVIVDQHATVKQYLSFVLPARHALKGSPVGKSWGDEKAFRSPYVNMRRSIAKLHLDLLKPLILSRFKSEPLIEAKS